MFLKQVKTFGQGNISKKQQVLTKLGLHGWCIDL